MIKSEAHYRITGAQAVRLETALREFTIRRNVETTDPILLRAQEEALQSQLDDLKTQMAEYNKSVGSS